MVNYQNGKIYRLVNDVDDLIYVGSTIVALSRRKASHKSDAAKHPEQRVYKHLNAIGWNNVHIILIEHYPCNSSEELLARERYYIDTLGAQLNKQLPGRTRGEYREQHRDKLIEYNREYREENREALAEQQREIVECECGLTPVRAALARHRKTKKHHDYMAGNVY